MKQLLIELDSAPEASFGNLIIGDNAAAIAAARALKPGETLYVWGQNGCGRSHLLQAYAREQNGAYLHSVRDADTLHQLAEEESVPHALAIDDIHLAQPAVLNTVFRLYNLWRERGTGPQAFSLVVSGLVAPLQMECREDLRTRLGWGAVYRLLPLSDTDKRTALKSYADARHVPIKEEILNWLLTHGSRDIRVLFDCISALDEYSLITHRPVTLPLLKTMLAERNINNS
ncbi:HdaA/DnaA family protein [Orrella sp. 11846]|uniref:HdaA/DnaA family protein n=1 Tax=Orrella sp. 11846 TaxID=3409913 RepID=UPI003B5C6824